MYINVSFYEHKTQQLSYDIVSPDYFEMNFVVKIHSARFVPHTIIHVDIKCPLQQ